MKGYGFALWLVPVDAGVFKTSHIPHLTLLCKLTLRQARYVYAQVLPELQEIRLRLDENQIPLNGNTYNLRTVPKESAYAIGAKVKRITSSRKQEVIDRLLAKYSPSLNITDLHVTLQYSETPIPPNSNVHPNQTLTYRLQVADVRNDRPSEWHLVRATTLVRGSDDARARFGRR
jgi:hypothetical protein